MFSCFVQALCVEELKQLHCVHVGFLIIETDTRIRFELLGELKNGTCKIFRALKVSNICQQTFENNFERCCQSFELASFLRSKKLSHDES